MVNVFSRGDATGSLSSSVAQLRRKSFLDTDIMGCSNMDGLTDRRAPGAVSAAASVCDCEGYVAMRRGQINCRDPHGGAPL
jgi:hypothetical protein